MYLYINIFFYWYFDFYFTLFSALFYIYIYYICMYFQGSPYTATCINLFISNTCVHIHIYIFFSTDTLFWFLFHSFSVLLPVSMLWGKMNICTNKNDTSKDSLKQLLQVIFQQDCSQFSPNSSWLWSTPLPTWLGTSGLTLCGIYEFHFHMTLYV